MNIIQPFEVVNVLDGVLPEFPLDLLVFSEPRVSLKWNNTDCCIETVANINSMLVNADIIEVNFVNEVCCKLLIELARIDNTQRSKDSFIVVKQYNRYGVAIL